jgi:Lipocalin-like domain
LIGSPATVNEHFPLEEGNMTDSNPFVGTWKLISWEVTQSDGTIQYPYGKDVIGYLIYTDDGYMSAEIMDPDRQQSDPNFPLEFPTAQTLPDADRARAYSTYLSYCGTYTVKANTVTHHVKAGLIPSWTGSEQPRPFRFNQSYLIIRVGNQKLTWERAVKHA